MAKCPRCCFKYDFDTNRNLHPVSLACGHTYCRACLLNICKNNRTCPACRTIFNGDVGVMPLDWTFLGLYTQNVYAGDVVAMLRNYGKNKPPKVADTVLPILIGPKKPRGPTAAEKKRNLQLALRLSLMYSQRRPLRASLSWSLNMITGRTANKSDSIPRAPTSHRALVHITSGKFSGNFADLISLANRATVPTIYDLCHRQLTYYESDSGTGSTTLTACNITFRNGSIHLGKGPMEDGPKFSVRGRGVGIEGIEIHGGKVGVWVEPGADVSLRDVTVRNACTGVWVGCTRNLRGPYPTAEMSALGLKVLGCGKGSAFGIGSAGSATISASELTGGEGCGILMCGDVPGRLLATDVRCWANAGKGVVVHSGNVVMTRCTIMDNDEGSVTVRGQRSKAELVSCTFNTRSIPVSLEGARLDVNDGSWTKVLFK